MNGDAKQLVAQMTLEEKASLCSGKDFWNLKGVERLGLESAMVTDGPHGLRKQESDADHLGIAKSTPATCFPPACATACSFDTGLLEEIGRAIGEECLQEHVAVILGPGVNIKRSPLCGRNFEYFSEDPLLAGELGAALIRGIQEKGVGTSLKHYALNNQEKKRMTIDVIADDRAMREVYLKAFEIAVKKSRPWTVMCSYNRINGTYASDNKWLLTDVLRGDWGFGGLVVTDWGAMNDRVEAVKAGCDLEMPASRGINDAKIVEAVKNGTLSEEAVDKCAIRVVELLLKSKENAQPDFRYDAGKHHALARRAAAESCVLLKNDANILPLKPGVKAAVIGAFAKAPRYQGTGSSKIVPTKIDNALEELVQLGIDATYAEGYRGVTPDDALIEEAVGKAKEAEVALVFAGLPDEYESEGFDRTALEMPESHVALIKAVAEANPNTVVVLLLGSPVITDWADSVKGLLVTYLGGQAGGGGAADVLTGRVCPGGKLPESWPLALSDNPSFNCFPGGRTVGYRESVYVGYRYYEAAQKAVAWPFGFGLSYTEFNYSDLSAGDGEVSFTLKNTGNTAGAETAQVYISLDGAKAFRPKKWLAGFTKVFLNPGERKTVKVKLDRDAFEYYNTAEQAWRVEGGAYTVYVGASSADLRLSAEISMEGDGAETKLPEGYGRGYDNITSNAFNEADFAALYGKPLPPSERGEGEPYTVNDTLGDIKHTKIGARMYVEIKKNAEKMTGDMGDGISAMVDAMLLDMPLRGIAMFGGDSLPPDFAQLLVDTLNGNWFQRTAATLKFVTTMGKAGKK
uniref:Beta-glucosidase n=1 Tax=uncultured bacterium contig00025 TaxID=1181514 RepID=A0A806K1G3_9BACT|nr:beta-glucosidase [uncultured bacterium contig00025]